MKKSTYLFSPFMFYMLLIGLFYACQPATPKEINIGYIGPLTGNAVDLGVGPRNAMELAVERYNIEKNIDEPKINFFSKNGKWDKSNAVPLYEKLRTEHKIDILFLSHTGSTVELQDRVLADGVILINSLNNDKLLSSLNQNTFKIGKKTEEAAKVVAARITELQTRKVGIIHVTNDFMTRSTNALTSTLDNENIQYKTFPIDIGKKDYVTELTEFKEFGCDAIVFFGYKNLGYAMLQARNLGIKANFYASTTTLGKGFFENSQGTIINTEFPFFTQSDGNYILGTQFLNLYKQKYSSKPSSVWPAMQAYDAMNITLNELKNLSKKDGKVSVADWLRTRLYNVSYYQGVCGNIAILKDGSSRGIYFSLYKITDENIIEKVKR